MPQALKWATRTPGNEARRKAGIPGDHEACRRAWGDGSRRLWYKGLGFLPFLTEVKSARPYFWLFALLLVFGQQAGVLHHLGHDLAEAVRVIGVAGGAAAADGQGLPDADGDAGSCVLCVGFGGAAAVSGDARCEPPSPALAFARPLAEAPILRPVALTGTPIRGPPQDFSSLA